MLLAFFPSVKVMKDQKHGKKQFQVWRKNFFFLDLKTLYKEKEITQFLVLEKVDRDMFIRHEYSLFYK